MDSTLSYNREEDDKPTAIEKASKAFLGVLVAGLCILLVITIVGIINKNKTPQSVQAAQIEQLPPKTNEYVGCYKDCNGRALPIRAGDGDIRFCEAKAREAGTEYFGLQFGEYFGNTGVGECWIGNGGYDAQGVATNCSKGSADYMVGGSCSNAVYKLL